MFFAFMQAIYSAFSRAFENNKFIHLFVRDSRVEKIYSQSLFAKILKAILNFITAIFAYIFRAISKAAKGSVAEGFAKRFLKSSFFFSFETLFGGFICLMFIIPHSYWSNTLALLAAVGFFVLYIILVACGVRKKYHIHIMGKPIL